ncbi:MAG: PIN domain nuclease [Halochromatium sp.]|nr:PIN domain nuclease [Halochromatium sp.]
MILVDSSVWIDFFGGTESPRVQRLERCIRDREDLALCGIVLTECLQGIRHDRQFARVLQHFRPLILLPMPEQVFISAAKLYRDLRAQGITIRKTNDCIIAATAIHQGASLLHDDRDFDLLDRHSALSTIS